MTNRAIRVLSMIGLLIGIGILYTGETGSCSGGLACAGGSPPFNQFMVEVDTGLIIIAVSAVALALSFLKRNTTLK